MNAIVRAPRMDVAGVRAELEAASAPAEVNAVRVKAEALRDMLVRALEMAGDHPPHLAQLRREADELALNAALKLGALVPVNPEGRPRGGEEKLPSLGSFSVEAGVPRSTLQGYRALHEALRAEPEAFGGLVESALSAGKPVPLGRLRRLVNGDADVKTKPRTWLGPAVEAATKAHGLCLDLKNNPSAPEAVKDAARAYAEGSARLCEQLRFALNREVPT